VLRPSITLLSVFLKPELQLKTIGTPFDFGRTTNKRKSNISTQQDCHKLWEQALENNIESTSRTPSEQAVLKQLKVPRTFITRLKKGVKHFAVFRGSSPVPFHPRPFAPASTIFGAVVFGVKVADGVSEVYDWIDQLFDKFGDFTVRLDKDGPDSRVFT
jgi:hypothetical protein